MDQAVQDPPMPNYFVRCTCGSPDLPGLPSVHRNNCAIVQAFQSRCYEQAWEAWSRLNPTTAETQKGAFMMGFQAGLLASELSVAKGAINV